MVKLLTVKTLETEMKIKVSEAEGPVLVWLVAKCEDFDTRNN